MSPGAISRQPGGGRKRRRGRSPAQRPRWNRQEASVEREFELSKLEADGLVHGDQLGPVGERALDLYVVHQLGHALHDVCATEDALAEPHELLHRSPLTDPFEEHRGDQRDGLGVVQHEAPGQALLRQKPRLVQHELVEVPGRQMHVAQRLSQAPFPAGFCQVPISLHALARAGDAASRAGAADLAQAATRAMAKRNFAGVP